MERGIEDEMAELQERQAETAAMFTKVRKTLIRVKRDLNAINQKGNKLLSHSFSEDLRPGSLPNDSLLDTISKKKGLQPSSNTKSRERLRRVHLEPRIE